ncbi:MAG TPA: hypothetical protein PLZ57_13005 [Pseudobdellovibrionaceae bacterium]|nr:hypothetical protein [Pseudobdellovibrionaceae bacterium]
MTPEPQASLSSFIFQQSVAVLRARGLALLGVSFFAALAARGLDDLFHFRLGLQDHPDHVPLVLTSLSLLSIIELLGLAGRLTFISQGIHPRPLLPDRNEFSLLLIESLRSLGATLWRVPLLLLPAIWEFIRLLPVPYIVMFDRSYRRGEVDALKASRAFFKRHRLFVFAMLGLMMFHAALLEFFEPQMDLAPIWEAPLDFLPSLLAMALLTMTVDLFVSLLFRYRSDQEGGA